jgi:hypothetical protein
MSFRSTWSTRVFYIFWRPSVPAYARVYVDLVDLRAAVIKTRELIRGPKTWTTWAETT